MVKFGPRITQQETVNTEDTSSAIVSRLKKESNLDILLQTYTIRPRSENLLKAIEKSILQQFPQRLYSTVEITFGCLRTIAYWSNWIKQRQARGYQKIFAEFYARIQRGANDKDELKRIIEDIYLHSKNARQIETKEVFGALKMIASGCAEFLQQKPLLDRLAEMESKNEELQRQLNDMQCTFTAEREKFAVAHDAEQLKVSEDRKRIDYLQERIEYGQEQLTEVICFIRNQFLSQQQLNEATYLVYPQAAGEISACPSVASSVSSLTQSELQDYSYV